MTTSTPHEVRHLDMQTREAEIELRSLDEKARTVDVLFSSETPVEQWWGTEILGHKDGEVDLSRMRDGRAPLLKDHRRDQQIGVVEQVRIADGVGRARVRFGKGELARQEFADVVDGIRSQISVGYRVKRAQLEETGPEGDIYRVTEWTPLEISTVAVGADPAAGVGRDLEADTQPAIFERSLPVTTPATTPEPPRIEVHPSQVQREERERCQDLVALGKLHNCADEARDAIQKGWAVDQFKAYVFDKRAQLGKPLNTAPSEIGLSGRDLGGYSIVRAIRAMVDRNWGGRGNASLEEEASRATAEMLRKEPNGFFIPPEVLGRNWISEEQRAAIAKGGSGGNLVATDLLAGSFIELLRKKAAALALGAQTLPGLVGDVTIPRQTGAATAAWVAEGAGSGETPQAFDLVTLTPKTLRARSDMTRKMILQSTPAIEGLVRNDLTAVIALEIDRAALFGSGSGEEPEGILNTTGIGAGTGGFTYLGVIDLETEIAVDNADMGALGYVTSAKGRGVLKGVDVSSAEATGRFVWETRDAMFGIVNGHRAIATNQCPDNLGVGTDETALLFGNWADLLIGQWGTLDIKPDEVTLGDSGGLVIRAFQDCDIDVRHPQSFAALQAAI